MPYNKFSIEQLKTKLNLTVQHKEWLEQNMTDFTVDSWLDQGLARAKKMFIGNEKARSEFLIAPVLQTLQYQNIDQLSLLSGYELNIDKSLGLNGFCDFILVNLPHAIFLDSPIFLIVECKKTEPELDDFAQCGAELYAAQLFNQQHHNLQKTIYGCATSGFFWSFLKLEGNVLTIDPNFITLSFHDPYKVLSTFQWILQLSLNNKHK